MAEGKGQSTNEDPYIDYRILEPRIMRYTTAVTTTPARTVIKVGAGKLYGITNNTPQPEKTLRVYDGKNLWFVKRLDEPFEMYKPLKDINAKISSMG
jgi:hypothetical protein